MGSRLYLSLEAIWVLNFKYIIFSYFIWFSVRVGHLSVTFHFSFIFWPIKFSDNHSTKKRLRETEFSCRRSIILEMTTRRRHSGKEQVVVEFLFAPSNSKFDLLGFFVG